MRWFEKIAASRQPDFIVGDNYLRRWWVIPRNKIFNIYLHQFLHSDEDRALHDHPWWNLSILLEGEYTEETILNGGVHRKTVRKAPTFKFRFASSAHRIELHAGPCWTLFITGPIIRRWGFHCPNGWRYWKDFVNPVNTGKVGRGCDD